MAINHKIKKFEIMDCKIKLSRMRGNQNEY